MADSFGGVGLITLVMVMSSEEESGGEVSFVFSSVELGLRLGVLLGCDGMLVCSFTFWDEMGSIGCFVGFFEKLSIFGLLIA